MSHPNFRRILATVCAAFVAGLVAFADASPAAAADAKITIEIYKAGFIAGVTGGTGTLTYKGKSHALSIGGVSLGATIGLSKAELVGEVSNLKQLADIAGTYSATQAGLAIAGGDKVAHLENAKGVRL